MRQGVLKPCHAKSTGSGLSNVGVLLIRSLGITCHAMPSAMVTVCIIFRVSKSVLWRWALKTMPLQNLEEICYHQPVLFTASVDTYAYTKKKKKKKFAIYFLAICNFSCLPQQIEITFFLISSIPLPLRAFLKCFRSKSLFLHILHIKKYFYY